jgi:Ca2+-binding EF-hand superfamily protein
MTKNFNMGDRKPTSIEATIKDVWKNAAENNMSGEQSFEVGTDRYAKHTTDLTPGQKVEEELSSAGTNKETEMSQEEFKKYVPDGTRMMSEQLIHVRMWQEAAEKEDLGKSPQNTAKKMKRAEEPKPMIATEEVVKEGYLELDFKDKQTAELAYEIINNEIWAGGNPPYEDFNQEGNSLQIDTDGNLNRRNQMLKDLEKGLPKSARFKFKIAVNEDNMSEGELPPALKKAIDAKKKKSGDEEETEEELSAKQKAIDLNKNGKVDGSDLAKLRKKGDKKEEANEELSIPQAQAFKIQSMKHALAKVWGMDDMSEGELPPALKKAIDAKKKGKEEAEEDMKGDKTETGKKVSEVEINPDLDKKKK